MKLWFVPQRYSFLPSAEHNKKSFFFFATLKNTCAPCLWKLRKGSQSDCSVVIWDCPQFPANILFPLCTWEWQSLSFCISLCSFTSDLESGWVNVTPTLSSQNQVWHNASHYKSIIQAERGLVCVCVCMSVCMCVNCSVWCHCHPMPKTRTLSRNQKNTFGKSLFIN